MPFRAIDPAGLDWITRPHEPGEPPERIEVPRGGVIHVPAMTPLQTVNEGDEDLVVYAYGCPPEDRHAEILESAI